MSETNLTQIWVYLSTSPLLGLIVTLIAYLAGVRLDQLSNDNPVVNPVVPATVAFAIPRLNSVRFNLRRVS